MQRAYVAAGARVLQTNTFGASSIKLDAIGAREPVAEINSAAGVAIARRAAGSEEAPFSSPATSAPPADSSSHSARSRSRTRTRTTARRPRSSPSAAWTSSRRDDERPPRGEGRASRRARGDRASRRHHDDLRRALRDADGHRSGDGGQRACLDGGVRRRRELLDGPGAHDRGRRADGSVLPVPIIAQPNAGMPEIGRRARGVHHRPGRVRRRGGAARRGGRLDAGRLLRDDARAHRRSVAGVEGPDGPSRAPCSPRSGFRAGRRPSRSGAASRSPSWGSASTRPTGATSATRSWTDGSRPSSPTPTRRRRPARTSST